MFAYVRIIREKVSGGSGEVRKDVTKVAIVPEISVSSFGQDEQDVLTRSFKCCDSFDSLLAFSKVELRAGLFLLDFVGYSP
jgi:hypothetical protein